MSKKIASECFVCLDCETTGLDPKEDRIIEVAAYRFTTDEITDKYQTLIDPQIPISLASAEFHNITDEMVKDKPVVEEVIPVLADFVKNSIIVGHGIDFDLNVIKYSAERKSIPFPFANNRVVDTLRLARYYGRCPVNSLQELSKHFDIDERVTHRAADDVSANIEVFRHLIKGFVYLEEIFGVLKRPIRMGRMPLGKYKGRAFSEIPLDYLIWAAKQDFDQDLLFTLRHEVKRRKGLFKREGNNSFFL